jgi:hypothetical protein
LLYRLSKIWPWTHTRSTKAARPELVDSTGVESPL